MSDAVTFPMHLGGNRHEERCRLYVINLAWRTIAFHPAGKCANWRGNTWRTPWQQMRLDKAFALRKAGATYREIGVALKISQERARQIVVKAQQERAIEEGA